MKKAVLIAALTAACMTPTSPHATRARADLSRIILEESCSSFMSCPTYRIDLTPDGHYRYVDGNRHPVEAREGQLGPNAWESAEAAFSSANWASMPATLERSGGAPCTPDTRHAVITRRNAKGNEKVFNYNLACNSVVANQLLGALRAAMPRPAP